MNQDMTGKTVVLTGASSGVGAAAARRLAGRGAIVFPVGRSTEATTAIAAELGTEPLIADYARLSDVRTLAERILDRCPTIDVLAHNAGLMAGERRVTEDGHELIVQVNYLAPFLLQHLLHDRLSESGTHVVVTSSLGHWWGRLRLDDLNYEERKYSTFAAYADSKLADVLFAREIARRTPETGITAVAFHPGSVASGLGRDAGAASPKPTARLLRKMAKLTMIDSDQGAQPLVHLATLADPRSVNGQYFHRLRPNAATSKRARDRDLGQALWERTQAVLDLPVPR